MPAAVVAPLGLSPPVVTEFVQWLVSRGIDVRRVYLLATDEEDVLSGARLIEAAISCRYPSIEVRTHELSYGDVDNEERAIDFLLTISKILSDVRGKYELYLLVSGGRKVMSIETALLSQFLPSSVFHVVARDVKVANILLESLRDRIRELSKSNDPISFYKSTPEFDGLMWPPLTEYSVIRLPTIPYPDVILEEVIKALKGARKDDVKLNLVPLLEQAGLIQVSKGYTVPTEYGRKLLEALKSIY
ncbi:MAG: CRISPR-associated ring nuclease [Candidatus Methanodesulfokora sp.]